MLVEIDTLLLSGAFLMTLLALLVAVRPIVRRRMSNAKVGAPPEKLG